jgi:hypothetical protein
MSDSPGIWANDLLGRETDARFLIDFLTQRVAERGMRKLQKTYCLNLNSGWGKGKTFFLTRLKKQLEEEGYPCAYINAWNDDHAGTPLISVMAAIDETLKPFLTPSSRKFWQGAKENSLQIAAAAGRGLAKQALKKYIGEEVHDLADLLSGNGSEAKPSADKSGQEIASVISEAIDKAADKYVSNQLEHFKARSRSIAKFKERTSKCLASIDKKAKLPLFVLVDELDRCRPTYAIELLEQIKHLFDIDNVIFIAATDTEQLRHSIGTVYGQGFDSSKYLLRFFDRTYSFEEPTLTEFISFLFDEYQIDPKNLISLPNGDHKQFIAAACRYYGLSLRDIDQCFDSLRTVTTLWPFKSQINLVALIPLIATHHLGQTAEFERLANHRTIPTGDKLQQRMATPWIVELPGDYGKTMKHHFVELSEALQRLLQKRIDEIFREQPPRGPVVEWAQRLLSTEVQQEDSGAIISRHSHSSLFPTMVRSAARLTKG